jgi:hypothetical protein
MTWKARMQRRLGCLALFALALPGLACAQFEPGATSGLAEGYRMDMLQSLVRDNTIPKPRAKPSAGAVARAATATPRAAAGPGLRVAYRDEVSQALREEILRESTGDPAADELLRPVIASGRMMGEYGKLMQHLGLSQHDLADVMTAYLLVSLEAVQGQTPTPAQRAAVRRDVAARLVATPALQRMPARDRQVLAERYAYSTLSTGLTFQVLKRANRGPELAQFRQRVSRNVARATGIDPARVALGESGLTAARR